MRFELVNDRKAAVTRLKRRGSQNKGKFANFHFHQNKVQYFYGCACWLILDFLTLFYSFPRTDELWKPCVLSHPSWVCELPPDISSRPVINTNGFPSELGPQRPSHGPSRLHPEPASQPGRQEGAAHQPATTTPRAPSGRCSPSVGGLLLLFLTESFNVKLRHLRPTTPGAERG